MIQCTTHDAIRQVLSYTELIGIIDAVVNVSATCTGTVKAETSTSASCKAWLSLPIAALLLLLPSLVY